MCSARVDEDFLLRAFRKGAAMVLLSGCHYADCHYISANRSAVRRVDGLWDGLEKAELRPDRLLLEWCSAAEGARWQNIMEAAEAKRQTVDAAEIERTRQALEKARVPRPRNPKPADENAPARFDCMRCGHTWEGLFSVGQERICAQCRSNSVRWRRRDK
jgi:coenzyme F420-reducing hydrogenase delta subunit